MSSNQSNSDAKKSESDPTHSLFNALEAAKKKRDAQNQNSDTPISKNRPSNHQNRLIAGILTIGLIVFIGILWILSQPASDSNLTPSSKLTTSTPLLPRSESTNKASLPHVTQPSKLNDSSTPPTHIGESDRNKNKEKERDLEESNFPSEGEFEPKNGDERNQDLNENPEINSSEDAPPQPETPQN